MEKQLPGMTELHMYKKGEGLPVGKSVIPTIDGVPLSCSFSVMHDAPQSRLYANAVTSQQTNLAVQG